jgi:tripartite-type tricarboxylate transporter receptor subunit TctC
VADFYRGKTVRFMVGFAAGGPFDIYARLVAKHLPRFIPGNPNIIVENRPGAGSLIVANAVYATEAKDGTVIGSFNESSVLQQATGGAGVQFDAAKFQWLGSALKTTNICGARTDLGVSSIQDTLNGKELKIGSTGPGANTYQVPNTLRGVLGANLSVVSGYETSARVQLAIESGEVDGMCISLDTYASVHRALLEGDKPIVKTFVVLSGDVPDHPFTKGVTSAESVAKTEEDKLLLRAVDAPARISKPYAVAPEVPRDRVAALRRALSSAFEDPQLLADARQAPLSISPSDGEEVGRVVQSLLGLRPDLLTKLADMIK